MIFANSIRLKKAVFLICSMLIMTCFILESGVGSTIDKIITNEKEIQSLDEKIIGLMELQMTEQPDDISKVVLKSESGDLWVFKVYESSAHVLNSVIVYYLACMLGIETPVVYEISLLINGELIYGSIQQFIANARDFNLPPQKLSKEQIIYFQQHQILDYLISNPDSSEDQFLLNLKTGAIIGIDKDESFKKTKKNGTHFFSWEDSYYDEFWDAYIKKEIDVNFKNSFQLIGLIQSFGDIMFRELFGPLFEGREELLEEMIIRKNTLKDEFEKFYITLTNKRGEKFHGVILDKDNQEYARKVLKKIETVGLRKQNQLSKLSVKKVKVPQNIEIIFAPQGWEVMTKLYEISRENFLLEVKNILYEQTKYRNQCLNIYQKFAFSLYINQINVFLKGLPFKSFFEEEIENIIKQPQEIDLFRLEHNFRVECALPRKSFIEYEEEIENNPEDILAHLNYIRGCLSNKEKNIILEEYRCKSLKSKNSVIYKLIYGILSNDFTYFKENQDEVAWKCLAKALVYTHNKERAKAIDACEKTINLNTDARSVYWAQVIKGMLYEYNDQWLRFGKGFNIKEAIKSYERALELKSDSVDIHLNLGNLYLIDELPEAALNEFEIIEKLNPEYARASFHLKNIMKSSEYKDKKEYLEAIKINTLSAEHHYILSLAYAIKKQNKLAKKHLDKAKTFGYEVGVKYEENVDAITDEIIKYEEKNWDIDRKIIDKKVFKLVEEQNFSGEGSEKMLLVDNDGGQWLFLLYPSPVYIKNSEMVYRLASLCGINLPMAREISLPINGKLRRGVLQRILSDAVILKERDLSNLSALQIEHLLKSQILEWLVWNYDTDSGEFRVNKQTGEIFCVDHDSSFDIKKGNLSPLGKEYSIYYVFWNEYLNKSINKVNVKRIFELINYIKRIDNRMLETMVKSVYGEEIDGNVSKQVMNMLILRKNELYSIFESLYRKRFQKNERELELKVRDKKNTYSEMVLKNIMKVVAEKKIQLDKQLSDKFEKQKNISVISSENAWYKVDELNYLSRTKFMPIGLNTIEELMTLEKNVPNIYEKLAINIYIEQTKMILRERNTINCGQSRIRRVIEHPDKFQSLFNIELNLRLSYGNMLKVPKKYKKKIAQSGNDILDHFNYIQLPIDVINDMDEEEKVNLLIEYKKKTKNSLMNNVIYGLLLGDINSFENIDDNFSWKYIAKGLLYMLDESRNKAINEFRKVLILDNNPKAVYWAHMLSGRFYKCNGAWFNVFEKFDVEEAILNYKKALEAEPSSVETRLNLGVLYLFKELPGEALKEFKIINKLDRRYGKEHFHFNKIKERSFYKNDKEYLESVRMNTLSGRHHYILGLAYTIKKDKELAKRHFDKANEFGYIEGKQ